MEVTTENVRDLLEEAAVLEAESEQMEQERIEQERVQQIQANCAKDEYQLIGRLLALDKLEDEWETLARLIDGLRQKRFTHIFTLDMGCGNTSGCIVKFEPRPLLVRTVEWRYSQREWDGSSKVMSQHLNIPTILGYQFGDEPGSYETVIGPEAIEYGAVAENFKQVPSKENLEDEGWDFPAYPDTADATGDASRKDPLTMRLKAYFRAFFKKEMTEKAAELPDLTGNKVLPEENPEDPVCDFPADPDAADATVSHLRRVPLEALWRDFFRAVFEKAMTEKTAELSDLARDNVLFVVARPASEDWENNIRTYRDLIVEATGLHPWQVLTFSEAKASMQYARVTRRNIIKWGIGVILIDLGASTIDIAYLSHKSDPKEWSIAMAGQQIDRLLGHRILLKIYGETEELKGLRADALPSDAFFKEHERELGCSTQSAFAFRMRMLKEKICLSGPEGCMLQIAGQDIEIPRKLLEDILKNDEYAVKFQCNDAGLADILNKSSLGEQSVTGPWVQVFRTLIQHVLDEAKKENEAQKDNDAKKDGAAQPVIIATGGTANLVGVKDAIKAVMQNTAGFSDAKLIMMDQPEDYERTVPWGSASYILHVINHLEHITGAVDTLRTPIREDLMQFAPDIIAEKIGELATEEMRKTLDEWVKLPNDSPDATLSNLLSMLRDTYMNADEFNTAIRKAESEICEKINSEAKNENDRQAAEDSMPRTKAAIGDILKKLSASKVTQDEYDLKGIKLSLDPTRLSHVVQNSIPMDKSDFIWRYAGNSQEKTWDWVWKKISAAWKTRKNKNNLTLLDRRNLYNDFMKTINLTMVLKEDVRKEFGKCYDQCEGFGVAEQVFANLQKDIEYAMFLRADDDAQISGGTT